MGLLRAAAILSVTVTAAQCAVDGDPDSPYPGHTGAPWVDTTNDGVISLRHHDDGLTAQVRAGAGGPDDVFRFAADWDVCTDRPSLRRCDTLTAVAGVRLYPGVVGMAGVRLEGDLGGQVVQLEAHRVFGDQTYGWRYHGSMRVEPTVVVVTDPDPRLWPLRIRTVTVVAPDIRQTDAQLVWDFGPHLRLEVGDVISAGRFVPLRRDPVVARADDQRAGPHAGFAIQAGRVGWGVEYGPHECIGRVGFEF